MILSSKDLNRFRIHRDEETIHQRDIVISHSAFVTINRLVGMTCSLASIIIIIIIIRYSVKKKKKKENRGAIYDVLFESKQSWKKNLSPHLCNLFSTLTSKRNFSASKRICKEFLTRIIQ